LQGAQHDLEETFNAAMPAAPITAATQQAMFQVFKIVIAYRAVS
jgi:hypothetical protein